MDRQLFEIVRFISSASVLVPLILLLIKWSRVSRVQRKLGWLLLGMFLCEFISTLFWYQRSNNHPIYHVYTILECLLILNIYYKMLGKYFTERAVVGLGGVFVIFAMYNAVFLQSVLTFNSNTVVVLSVLVICITLVFFYDLLNSRHYSSLGSNALFWISAGLLIYYASNLFLFYLINKLNPTQSESYTIWGLHAFIHILLIIFFTRALWIQEEKE